MPVCNGVTTPRLMKTIYRNQIILCFGLIYLLFSDYCTLLHKLLHDTIADSQSVASPTSTPSPGPTRSSRFNMFIFDFLTVFKFALFVCITSELLVNSEGTLSLVLSLLSYSLIA